MSFELMAPLMFGGLVVFLLLGYPVAFSLSFVGLLFAGIGIWHGTLDFALLQALPERVLGIMANEDPKGATRAEIQRDLARRDDYATAANALWIVGGMLGATAIGMFVLPRAVSDGR